MPMLLTAITKKPMLYRRLTPEERWVVYLSLRGVSQHDIAVKMKLPTDHIHRIYHDVSTRLA